MYASPEMRSGPRRAATLRRSVDLFRKFRVEQTQPDIFYSALARDAVDQVGTYADLSEATLVDVGGGPGYFADAFAARGVRYFPLNIDLGDVVGVRVNGLGGVGSTSRAIVGDGANLPLRSNCVDVCYSSNVAEHMPNPWRMADEMVRVTRSGGLVFLSYTLWYGPWGGHETVPWHYFGGDRAARRYERVRGHPPKNVYGQSLFKVTATAGMDWARNCAAAEPVAFAPRYLPGWTWPVVNVPGVRELALWNLLIVMRKR